MYLFSSWLSFWLRSASCVHVDRNHENTRFVVHCNLLARGPEGVEGFRVCLNPFNQAVISRITTQNIHNIFRSFIHLQFHIRETKITMMQTQWENDEKIHSRYFCIHRHIHIILYWILRMRCNLRTLNQRCICYIFLPTIQFLRQHQYAKHSRCIQNREKSDQANWHFVLPFSISLRLLGIYPELSKTQHQRGMR